MSESQSQVPISSVYHNGHHYLLHASRVQLEGIANSLNELCNGIHIEDSEFQTQLGQTRDALQQMLSSIGTILDSPASGPFETTSAYADGFSIQARCMSAYGEAVDMGITEARAFAKLLNDCADKADAFA